MPTKKEKEAEKELIETPPEREVDLSHITGNALNELLEKVFQKSESKGFYNEVLNDLDFSDIKKSERTKRDPEKPDQKKINADRDEEEK